MENLGIFADVYPTCPFPKTFSAQIKKSAGDIATPNFYLTFIIITFIIITFESLFISNFHIQPTGPFHIQTPPTIHVSLLNSSSTSKLS